MQFTSVNPSLIQSYQPPKTSDSNENLEQVKKAALDFEGVFVSLLTKELRNTLGEGGFFGKESSDSLGGMFDMFMGKHLAESKPLGIADIWIEQYKTNNSIA